MSRTRSTYHPRDHSRSRTPTRFNATYSRRNTVEATNALVTVENLGVPSPGNRPPVAPEDIAIFKRLFVFHAYEYAIQAFDWTRRLRSPWKRIPTKQHPPLNDADLSSHLDQQASLAVYAARREQVDADRTRRISMTRHLLIDLDRGKNDHDLRARAGIVREALGDPSFVLSSPGGGAHLIYMFDDEVPLFSLRGPGGLTGSVIDLLTHRGLPEQRGTMEAFPAARCWQAQENGCRLPFGPGAYLLDPHSLSLEDSSMFGVRALHHVAAKLATGEIEYVDVNAWRARSLQLPITRRTRPDVVVVSARSIAQPFLEHGLRAYGERRRAVRALAYHWWWQSRTEDDAVELTRDWLWANHNHCSRDWNAARDKSQLLQDCEEVVRFVYARRRRRSSMLHDHCPALTLSQVRPLLELALRVGESEKAGQPVKVMSRTKSVRIDPVKLVDFGVHILQRFVGRLQQIATLAYEHADGRFDDTYRRIIKRCQPDYQRQRFRLPLPKSAMIAWLPSQPEAGEARAVRRRSVGKDSVAAYIKFLLEHLPTTFTLASDYFAQGRKCRDFWVQLDLMGDQLVSTGAEAWVLTGQSQKLEKLVSPYVWKQKILPTVKASEGGYIAKARPREFALGYVRGRMVAAASAQRSIARVAAGITLPPVAPDWRRDEPERFLTGVPERLKNRLSAITVTLSYTQPCLVANFVHAPHLRQLLFGTQDVLEPALQDCFPDVAVRTVRPSRVDTGLRIQCEFAGGVKADADTRLLRRSISKATEAAIREAIWRARLHLLESEDDAEL